MAVAAREMGKLVSFSDPKPVTSPVDDWCFPEFIKNYRALLEQVFAEPGLYETINSDWRLPDKILGSVLANDPLRVYIDKSYGGGGAVIAEGLSLLEATSYHSLALSLMIGINGALFLQPVGIYGDEKAKKEIFTDFIANKRMGGMMITEPDYGSDALRMRTSFTKANNNYRVQGMKHWAGLTGKADYWLLAAREKKEGERLGKDIAFFIRPPQAKGIEVLEYYRNVGLRLIPYGKNKVDVQIPDYMRLNPRSSGIKMLTDILHRSRLQFPGMGVGFLRRLMECSMEHCQAREVGGKSLADYDQVKRRVSSIQSNYTVCSAMCAYTSKNAGTDQDLSSSTISANSIKALVTDYMQESAHSAMQLFGAKSYHLGQVASRSMVDSRPFQIFEGSNDILYQQITEAVLKAMKKMKITNFYEFLCEFELTKKAAGYFKDQLSFELSPNMAQNKIVDLGRIIARVVSLEFTLSLGASGFNSGMISSAVDNICSEVKGILSNYKDSFSCKIFDDVSSNTSWQQCLNS